MDLTEAEDIKKRWQEYTEEQYKNDLNDPDNHDGVITPICQQIWKTQQWPQAWKRSVFIPIPKKATPKNVQSTTHLHSSHMLAK